MPTFTDRLKHAWNAFNGRDHPYVQRDIGPTSYYRIDRPRMTRGNERSIITAIYNRIALDVSAIAIHHVQCDENDRFREVRKSPLDEIFSLQANIDQTGRAFVQDAVLSMFDEGVVALVPTETGINPEKGSYDIYSARVARILQWMPKHVRVRLYNDLEGKQDELICEKKNVAFVENPFFVVMHEPNSTMQRLIRKLNILDAIDEQSGSGKLDLIIQLPYVVRSEAKRQEADRRARRGRARGGDRANARREGGGVFFRRAGGGVLRDGRRRRRQALEGTLHDDAARGHARRAEHRAFQHPHHA